MTTIPPATNKERVADALFRGVSAQLVRGVVRWLELRSAQILVCERDEDIDTIENTGGQLTVVAEQVKAEVGRLSARSDRMQETISNFAIAFHRYTAQGDACEFIFTTTAEIAHQQTDDEVPIDILREWWRLSSRRDLAKRNELITSIKALERAFRATTKNAERVSKVAAAFANLDAGNWDRFLLAVRWVFEAADYVKVRANAEASIGADVRFRELPAHLVFERLLVEVLQCSSHKDIEARALTRARLDQLALLTTAELEQWLATNSGILRRLAQYETELAEIRQLVTMSRRPVSSGAMRAPTTYATSARLTQGVEAVETRIAAGARVIGLRGAPGDGKTQAARQLGARASGASYWELPNVANVSGSVDVNEVWRLGLAELASAMSGESCADLPLEGLARIIRERMAFLPRPHLLVLDNADSDAPIDLRDLLADEAAIVAVGGGAFAFSESVAIRKALPSEFVEMVNQAADTLNVQPSELALVEEIGALVDNSPLLAGFVSERLGSDAELRDLRDDLSSAGSDARVRMHAVFLKAWRNLPSAASRLALVLGSWAEPDVPISWIPPEFRLGDAVQILARSHLANRIPLDRASGLRVHRLVIQWIRSEDVGSMAAVAEALVAWAAAPELSDELKSGGRRKLALVRAFELAHKRGALKHLEPITTALLASVYIDQSTVFGSDAAAVERQVNVLAPTARHLDDLHPAVLGQMIDALRLAVIEGSAHLRALRERAIVLLEEHVESLRSSTEVSLLDLIAEHHFGKHLLHVNDGKRRQEGLAILQRADAQASRALEEANGASKTQWLLRRSKTRIQICDQQVSPISALEAIAIMRGELANTELPSYIRLVAARQLLRRAAGLESRETVATLRVGLELLTKTQHDDVATLFLSEASKVAPIVEGDPVAHEIEVSLEGWLQRLLTAPAPSKRGAVAVAFGNAKLAEGFSDAKAMARMMRALLLLERVLDGGDPYHRQRVLAVLRDAGALAEASALADRDQDVDWYWTQYEVAETWRWSGEFDKATEMLATMAADPKNAKQLTWINDERAKLLGKQGDLAAASLVLEANVSAWKASNEAAYGDRCDSWRKSLAEGRLLAADGLLEDEWRSEQRRSAVADVELDALTQVAGRMAHGVLAATRRAR